jgi:hypothetical protein
MGEPTYVEWGGLLARFAPASPELVVRRELRRRTDSKFVLSPSAALELLGALTSEYAVLGTGNGPLASYRTLYFDTPELDFFHAHRRGYRVRHKVRVRHYPDRRLTSLEVKTRLSELETTKTWRAREFGDGTLSREDQAFIGIQSGITQEVLPQVWTGFRRLTLLGIATNERLTVDLDLRVEGEGRERSFAAIAIVEVKQWPHDRATPVMAALRAAGRRPGWVSKYCTAIAFTRPEVRCNKLLPGLRALEWAAA